MKDIEDKTPRVTNLATTATLTSIAALETSNI